MLLILILGGTPFCVQLVATPLTDEIDLDDIAQTPQSDNKIKSGLPPGPSQWERLVLWRAENACECDLDERTENHGKNCTAPCVEVPDILCR